MKINKILQRLLVFLVGVPAVLLLVILLPEYNQPFLNIAVVVASLLGSLELRSVLSSRIQIQNPVLTSIYAVLIPLAGAICSVLDGLGVILPFTFFDIIPGILFLVFFISAFAEIFFNKSENFEHCIQRSVSSLFFSLYPGFFLAYLSILTTWNYSLQILAILFVMVFACDSCAWLLGVLLGRNNAGIVRASPNKSIAGFIGGYLGSIATGIVGYFVIPDFFNSTSHPILKLVITGFLVATASIVGDLYESAEKRNSSKKDSGFLIPGRGGLLDSIDSLSFACPVFFYSFLFFFGV